MYFLVLILQCVLHTHFLILTGMLYHQFSTSLKFASWPSAQKCCPWPISCSFKHQRTSFAFTAFWHEDCWNILPHVLHDGLLCPAVGTLTATVTEEKERNNRKSPDFFQGIPMQKSHPYNLSVFAVVQLLVSKETSGSPNIIPTLWL